MTSKRNPIAKALQSRSLQARILLSKKGKGSYKRQAFKKF